jgi:hexosaminidase
MTNSTITMPMTSKLQQRALASLTVAVLFLAGCGKADHAAVPIASESISSVNHAADQIQIKLGIENNDLSEGCPNDAESCYRARMTLQLPDNMPKNWRIMFSNLSPINHATSNEFNLVHVNGDMHAISAKTTEIKANTAYDIVFYGNTPLVSESVLFPNYLLIAGDGETSVIASTTEQLREGHQVARPQHVEPFTRPEQLLRSNNDKVFIANASERLSRFSSRMVEDSETHETRIIPKIQMTNWLGDKVVLSAGIQLPEMSDSLGENFKTAVTQRFSANGLTISPQGLPIKATLKKDATSESYSLLIKTDDIQIEYADSAGLYYAMMSIAQLYDAQNKSLPLGAAKDQPSMAFRGLHIDVSRNFRSKKFILQTLDQMSYYKLNKLHLHLADDEGWRLQIASLPELTEVGAFRCFDESEQNCLLPQLAGGNGKLDVTKQNSGFYSINDYIEILQYADARQIEVLPSLDMPGHSRAAIVSMNARYQRLMKQEKPDEAAQYFLTELEDKSEYRSIQHYNDNTLNPCLPATYTFIGEVLERLMEMHKSAGVPLQRYHIGADETAGAWTESPACAALIASNDNLSDVKQLGSFFVEKVAKNVSELGVLPAAWSDGLSHANSDNLPTNLQSNAWETLYSGGHSKVHEMINKGWQVVLSTPDVLYFDFPYEADPIEPGYYWGSRYTDSYQVFQFMPNNLGVHAEIWTDKFGKNYEAPASVDIQDNGQVLGIQAQIWGETVRSDAQANYMLFPRLLAVAERAWHTPQWAESYQNGVAYSAETTHFDAAQIHAMNADWFSFGHVLSHKAMPQLAKDGIEPRVPLPGAVIKDGMLHIQSGFDGLQLEYKIRDGNWQAYDAPVKQSLLSDIKVRAKIPRTQITSRELKVGNN